MASKHILRFSAIVNFFKEEEKLIARGENAVESGHIKDMAFDSQFMIIKGSVHASMRDRVYKVEVNVFNNYFLVYLHKNIENDIISCIFMV
nr:unnamed protein product [Callosobruchus chinensis]